MIEMTITAQDANDLKVQVAALAVILLAGTPVPEPVTEVTPVIPAEPNKPPRKHRATKSQGINGVRQDGQAIAGAPEPSEPQPVTVLGAEVSPQDRHDPVINVPQEQTVITPPKEALELKQKVIDALQAAFRAGKVQKVRDVLANYGGGAKSFREIDAVAFPVIDKAIQSGALN